MIPFLITLLSAAASSAAVAAVFLKPSSALSMTSGAMPGKDFYLLSVAAAGLLLVFKDIAVGAPSHLVADIALAALPFVVLPSVSGRKDRKLFCIFVLCFEALSLPFPFLKFSGGASAWPALYPFAVFLSAVISFIVLFRLHLAGIGRPADRVSPLSVSALLSDVIYLCLLCVILLLSAMNSSLSALYAHRESAASAVDAAGFAAASALFVCCLFRRAGSRHFLLLEKYEQMVAAAMQNCMGSRTIRKDRKDNLYRTIFGRIEEYFRQESPYLDSDISISGVSERVYTNKLYVSRAISECTGRNFCQYVNSYRIKYAMECFRNNPDLKVSDLSAMSGFHTIASYNTAFRRMVGEIPSDWMRRTGSSIRRDASKLARSAPAVQAV